MVNFVCLYIAILIQPRLATKAINANSKGKDHLILQGGEHIIVLLTSHDKLPEGKYLCEKTDGTGEVSVVCMASL